MYIGEVGGGGSGRSGAARVLILHTHTPTHIHTRARAHTHTQTPKHPQVQSFKRSIGRGESAYFQSQEIVTLKNSIDVNSGR